jgi:hypothetical protein
MVSYTLVREYRTGRQQESDTVHLISEDADLTVCQALDENELRNVRNIGAFVESGVMCSECGESAEDIC